MKLEIPYLSERLSLEIPDEQLLAVAEPNPFECAGSVTDTLNLALSQPCVGTMCDALSLDEFLNGASRILIIINDATRPTPTSAMLSALLPVCERHVALHDIILLVATGAHRAPTEAEYEQILGPMYRQLRPHCTYHDSRDPAQLATLGTTRNGTPITLNKHVFEVDRIIVTGSVEPHYFAGFTGGRKAFLPGIAGFSTIEANHRHALSPRARSLALEGNPVHEDMMDALRYIDVPVFALMTVLDKEQKVAAATSGDLVASFSQAVAYARRIFCVSIPARADIVVSVAKFPMDIDLYQSQKAIDNGALALKDGGTLILVSSCRDGIGDTTYARLLAQADSPSDALARIRKEYLLGFHKAAKMAEVAQRATIVAVSELSDEVLSSMFIEKQKTLDDAFRFAKALADRQGIARPTVIVLPDGCVTIPTSPDA